MLPPHVLVAEVPVRIVERRIGRHVIGLAVFVQVAAERVGVFGAEVAFDAAKGRVHHCQPPRRRVGLLLVGCNVANPAVYDVLVLGRVPVVAELVGGEPELGLETEIGGAVVRGTATRWLLLR